MIETKQTALEQLAAYTENVLNTAEPAAFDHLYLVPGIVGEVGEMFGHRAKAFWHGKPQAELEAELKLELGDVAWMTALLISTQPDRGVPNIDGGEAKNGQEWSGLLTLVEELLYQFSHQRRDRTLAFADRLWAYIRLHAQALTGHSFQEVLDANIQKLADRAARNVLRGSGDHR